MEIYSLSGASGTGKSTSALQFAHEHQIRAIIDDGLLIVDGKKVAGTSAKFEKSALRAVRRAIFEDEQHQQEVKSAIRTIDLASILIIGTSMKMTKRIAGRLELGEISYFHTVEEIRSKKDIARAKYIREIQGQHLMPVPFQQVEQNFFKRFIQRGKDIFSSNRIKIGETTIVRPDFHKQSISISKSVYIDIVKYLLEQNPYVVRYQHMQCNVLQVPRIYFELNLVAPVTYAIPDIITQLQQSIADNFLTHFQIEPEYIHIKIIGVETKY